MKKCLVCGKKVPYHVNSPVCPGCEEEEKLMYSIAIATDQWLYTRKHDDEYWRRALYHVNEAANKTNKTVSLLQQAKQLDEAISEIIRGAILYYNSHDLIAGTLVIKEFCRPKMLEVDEHGLWHWVTEMEAACIIQQLVLSIDEIEFLGHSLGDSYDDGFGFIIAIVFARIQVTLRDNIDRYQYLPVTENLMDFATDLFEDQSLIDYFDKLEDMGPEEKPEDLEIEDKLLGAYLQSRGLLPKQIYSIIEEEVEKLFGFTFEEAKVTIKTILNLLKKKPKAPLIVFRKEAVLQQIASVVSPEKASRILFFFSLNGLSHMIHPISERVLELRSIYQTGEFIIFGVRDLDQNIGICGKLVVAGHYLDMYLPGIKTPQALVESQQKMATLLSYKIAESLDRAGYLMPRETVSKQLGDGQVIRAEIDKILDNKIDILKGKGDIDVLALNVAKAEILLIELKYLKPGRTIREIVLNDPSKIETKKVIEKILAREEAIKMHLDAVLNLFEGVETLDGFKVRSILVTTRPNFKGVQKDLGIEYYTWTELEKLIETKSL